MRLADFILSNVEPILAGWEYFARSLGAGEYLDQMTLRDHAGQILEAIALYVKSPQTAAGRAPKPEDGDDTCENNALDDASDAHTVDRLGLGFDLLDVISEYRALRVRVLQLWHDSAPGADERDLNELTRFNESIDQSLSNAVASYIKQADQARDMFLAILSHDLRNPLGAIAMSAQALPMVSDDKFEILECGSRITRSASVMERMICDMLDYARTRLSAGMPINPGPLDLAALSGDLIAEYRAAYPNRAIEYHVDSDLIGQWDSHRIRQAISNLIGNARHHGSAELPVTLSLRAETANVFIEIHNGGDPIPPGELSKIFDPLIRGSSAERPKSNCPGGIGMGLYIAREVAKSHGGQIDVISTVAEGTSFTIRLPRQAAPKVGQPILDALHIEG